MKYMNGDMAGETIEEGHFIIAADSDNPLEVLGRVSLVLEPDSDKDSESLLVEFDPNGKDAAERIGVITGEVRTDEDTGIEIPEALVHPSDIKFYEWQVHEYAFKLFKDGDRIVDYGFRRRPGTVKSLFGWASSEIWGHMSRLYEVDWDDGVTELMDAIQLLAMPEDWHPEYPLPETAVLFEPDVSKWGEIGPTREGGPIRIQ